jgi:hypothetical protein
MKKLVTLALALVALAAFSFPAIPSEPVPGAEITVEQVPGPIVVKQCVTGKDGAFSVSIKEINLAAERIKRAKPTTLAPASDTITLLVTITPPKGWTGVSTSNQVTVAFTKVPHKDIYWFVVSWVPALEKTNKGCFAINPKAQS